METSAIAGKNVSVSIFKKLEVIDFYENLPPTATAKEKVTMVQFPESLTSQGMLGRWRKSANKLLWRTLSEELQKQSKEMPNWLTNNVCADALPKGRPSD